MAKSDCRTAILVQWQLSDRVRATRTRVAAVCQERSRRQVAAGFKGVALQLNIAVGPTQPLPWQAQVNIAGNPPHPHSGRGYAAGPYP